MRDLAALAEMGELSFRPLFVHMGTPQQADEFFARFDPEARAVSDPDKELYRAFGLERGSVWSLLGPGNWLNGSKAMLKGNSIGMPIGDPLMMPGLFLVKDRQVVWRQVSAMAGESPRFQEMESIAASLRAAG